MKMPLNRPTCATTVVEWIVSCNNHANEATVEIIQVKYALFLSRTALPQWRPFSLISPHVSLPPFEHQKPALFLHFRSGHANRPFLFLFPLHCLCILAIHIHLISFCVSLHHVFVAVFSILFQYVLQQPALAQFHPLALDTLRSWCDTGISACSLASHGMLPILLSFLAPPSSPSASSSFFSLLKHAADALTMAVSSHNAETPANQQVGVRDQDIISCHVQLYCIFLLISVCDCFTFASQTQMVWFSLLCDCRFRGLLCLSYFHTVPCSIARWHLPHLCFVSHHTRPLCLC